MRKIYLFIIAAARLLPPLYADGAPAVDSESFVQVRTTAEIFENTSGENTIIDKNGTAHGSFGDVSRELLSEQNVNGRWTTEKEPLFTAC